LSIVRLVLDGSFTRELQHPRDDVGGAPDLGFDGRQLVPHFREVRVLFGKRPSRHHDGAERIVDLMSDPGRKGAHGGQIFVAP
jgi:hypothetical protein